MIGDLIKRIDRSELRRQQIVDSKNEISFYNSLHEMKELLINSKIS